MATPKKKKPVRSKAEADMAMQLFLELTRSCIRRGAPMPWVEPGPIRTLMERLARDKGVPFERVAADLTLLAMDSDADGLN